MRKGKIDLAVKQMEKEIDKLKKSSPPKETGSTEQRGEAVSPRAKKLDDQAKYYVRSSTEKKNVPNFLIEETNNDVDLKNLLNGLKLVSDYLEKSILKPNNINLPNTRINFVNLLK